MNPTPEPARRPYLRKLLFIVLALFGPGFTFGLVFGTGQFYPERVPVKGAPADYGLKTQPLAFTGADGVPTAGWYIAPPASPAPGILLLHGYSGRRDRMLSTARFLHDAGFGISMMDLRHHGDAGDGAVTFGIREAESVMPYLTDLAGRPEHAGKSIGILGCSLGAVTALKVASLDRRVAAVVADSPFDSLVTQSRWVLEHRLPRVVVPYCWVFTVLAGSLVTGIAPWEWEVGDWVATLPPRPVLFIHGVADARIPVECSVRLLQRAGPHAESWLVEGAGHLDAMYDRAPEYAARVTQFFRKHLDRGEGASP